MKIQSVAFGNGQVEIAFIQDHNVGDFGVLVETAVFTPDDVVEAELVEVHDALEGLVERWLVNKRNPPERVRSRLG